MTGHGGWPMTVFLTPDGRPYFGGTYYPKTARHGLPSFSEVLPGHGRTSGTSGATTPSTQAGELTSALGPVGGDRGRRARPCPAPRPSPPPATRCAPASTTGGAASGRRPSSPSPTCSSCSCGPTPVTPTQDTLGMVTVTLDAMASGGMYDHLGGGFARYSTDAEWLVPHFEKMLYRPGPAGRASTSTPGRSPARSATCRSLTETIDYVRRDLRHPDGGFFSSEDADSEGVEGKFYVWSEAELRELLGDRADEAIAWWGVTAGGNFEGANILHRPGAGRPGPVAGGRGGPADPVRGPGEAGPARPRRQGAHRVERPVPRRRWPRRRRPPGATTGWPTPGRRASSSCQRCAGPTAAGCGRGRAASRAATWPSPPTTRPWSTPSPAWPRPPARPAGSTEARAAADAMLELFWDDEAGGLFTTGTDAEALITRTKDLIDNAVPVGQRQRGRRPSSAWAPWSARATTPSGARTSSACWPASSASTRPPSAGPLAAADLASPPASPRSPSSATGPTWCGPCRRRYLPERGAGLGRAVPVAAVRGPQGRPGLRVRELRLPGAGVRRRQPAGPAGGQRLTVLMSR